jgi:alpha-tubulin suppressor-like RCC1 family protein
MKCFNLTLLLCLVCMLAAATVSADERIRGGQWADAAPAVAYNTANEEYLVVWNEFMTVWPFYGPVMGRILGKNGQKLTPSFPIFASGVKPTVVYDPDRNENCVACESNLTTNIRFLSDRGMRTGVDISKPSSTFPRVLYNTLARDFLLVAISIQENPAGSGNCDHSLVAQPFDRNGLGTEQTVRPLYNSACTDGEYFAVAFAPIDTPLTPYGRYLVGVENVNYPLYMLNRNGTPVVVKTVPAGDSHAIDFDSEAVIPVNMDIAFGFRNNDPQDPVFLVVWGESGDRSYDGFQWTGIYGGVVEADLDDYGGEVNNFTFPISLQWSHLAQRTYAETWNPKAAYNPAAGRFLVTWRETPGPAPDPRDLALYNHIRANTIRQDLGPYAPDQNFLLSTDIEAVDPGLPALAAGGPYPLSVWQDNRNNATAMSDIYGTMIDASHKTTVAMGGDGRKWISVAAGYDHSLAIRNDGTLWAWGYNLFGELGIDDTTQRNTPVQVGSDKNWVAITAGNSCSLGIRTDGSLWAWGDNSYGRLGLGDSIERHTPTQVGSDKNWLTVSAGLQGSILAIRSDGTLWAWGRNFFHQLGLGDTNEITTPTRVGNESNWLTVKVGFGHTLGIRTDHSLWAWGWNAFGQMGRGNTIDSNVPVQIGTGNWLTVDAGNFHSLGIQTNGSLWAWGSNDYGQVGLPDVYDRLSPVPIDSSSPWKTVEAGGEFSLGLRSDHTLWAWGRNESSQLGMGNYVERYFPEQVSQWDDWVTVAAGNSHSLGIRADGSLWAWGWNGRGQLGLGDSTNRNVPTLVGKQQFSWLLFLPAIVGH